VARKPSIERRDKAQPPPSTASIAQAFPGRIGGATGAGRDSRAARPPDLSHTTRPRTAEQTVCPTPLMGEVVDPRREFGAPTYGFLTRGSAARAAGPARARARSRVRRRGSATPDAQRLEQ